MKPLLMMSADSNDPDGGGAGGPVDPLQMFASTIQESLVTGLAALESTISRGLEEIGASQDAAEQPAKDGDLTAIAARAYLVAAASGLRYWSGLARSYGDFQSSALPSVLARAGGTNVSEAERRGLAEDFRKYLREVSDLSLQEARLLQLELEQLAEAAASAVGDSEPGSVHRRRWKAKP
jgi:hypothetical protein